MSPRALWRHLQTRLREPRRDLSPTYAAIDIPHSQSGVIDRADYDNTVKLVVQMLQKLSAAEVRGIREF